MKKSTFSFLLSTLLLTLSASTGAQSLSRDPCKLSRTYCREGFANNELRRLSADMRTFRNDIRSERWASAHARSFFIVSKAREYGVVLPAAFYRSNSMALAQYNRLESQRIERMLNAVPAKI